ncbi:MAG: hypothetical protein CMK74_14390 [Pseudomonadales bacterium]|nr:hypothetical protein [Pseudomonadales bacterium]|tara:strand:- start:251 stop:1477 length:1227 start_codon:yes stop_codon:yes gene_type:complete
MLIGVLAVPAFAVEHNHITRPGEVVLRATVEFGMLDACGYREAPHVIEHLLLSDTQFGATAADMMVSLHQHGVALEAVTRQDFTEYVLHGPASKAAIIEEAATAILARPQLPSSGFETEIKAILLEHNASSDFVSRGAYFEQYAAVHHGTRAPCRDDALELAEYSHANVQGYYDAFYVQDNISLLSVGPTSELDVARVAERIAQTRPDPERIQRYSGERLGLNTIKTAQFPGTLEVLIAVPGRDTLPHYLAQQFAETLRLELQAYLRKAPVAYQARSVVHQSKAAGWVSLTALVGKESAGIEPKAIEKLMTELIDEYRFTTSGEEIALISNFDLAVSPELLQLGTEQSSVAAVRDLALESIDVSIAPHRSSAPTSKRNIFLLIGAVALLVLLLTMRRKQHDSGTMGHQ